MTLSLFNFGHSLGSRRGGNIRGASMGLMVISVDLAEIWYVDTWYSMCKRAVLNVG